MVFAISHETRSGFSTATAAPTPRQARAALLLVVLAGALAGYLATDPVAAGRACAVAGGDLTRLLRAMAAIKAVMALAAAGGVLWRLGSPASPRRLVAYLVAVAAMTAGPGLIWNMVQLGAGALLLHAGLFATVVMLWRDPAVTRRISDALASRRASR
jgi:hypothetical protein